MRDEQVIGQHQPEAGGSAFNRVTNPTQLVFVWTTKPKITTWPGLVREATLVIGASIPGERHFVRFEAANIIYYGNFPENLWVG